MKKLTKPILLASAAAVALATPAFADDAAPAAAPTPALTANGEFTTDYIFRGISQSAKKPAVSGGLDYDLGNGFAVGTWVSSIDFGDHTPFEWDIYGNYNFMLGALTASVGVYSYVYVDAGQFGPYSWVEGDASLGYDFGPVQWSAKGFWGPSVPNGYVTIRHAVNPKGEYFLTTGLTAPLADWISVSGNVGYQGYISEPTHAPNDDYTEYDLGATLTYDKYSLDLRYLDTSLHAGFGGPYFATGPFYVATFSFKFP
jgi:uncharacterized protein (TIGR02001 family)